MVIATASYVFRSRVFVRAERSPPRYSIKTRLLFCHSVPAISVTESYRFLFFCKMEEKNSQWRNNAEILTKYYFYKIKLNYTMSTNIITYRDCEIIITIRSANLSNVDHRPFTY